MELIEEACKSGARRKPACEELSLSVRTVERWRQDGAPKEDQRPYAQRPVPSHKLSEEEKQKILEITRQAEFQSLPPSQIVPILADRGEYIASESSMYRVLHANNQQHHRGKAKNPRKSSEPTSHCATAANQVWMWDITWLPGPVRGLYFYLYLILDLYSRKIVGWEIWDEESAENASRLVKKAYLSEGIALKRQENPLILHSDNGSPMKGATLLDTLYQLGVQPSRSRPRVSNDNPYAESIFRTCKYRPEYPEKGFIDIVAARTWILTFVRWYNQEHRHSGLKFLTRSSVIRELVIKCSQSAFEYMKKLGARIHRDGPGIFVTGRYQTKYGSIQKNSSQLRFKNNLCFPVKSSNTNSGLCDTYLDKYRK